MTLSSRIARGLLAALLLPTLGGALSRTPALAQTPVAEVASSAFPSVLSLSILFERPPSRPGAGDGVPVNIVRPGSGVVIGEQGLVLTCAHLVAELPDGPQQEGQEFWLSARTAEGRAFGGYVVARDERSDLALVQLVIPGGRRLPALPLADVSQHVPGERVTALCLPDANSRYCFAGALAEASGETTLREAVLERDEMWISDARFHDLLDGGPLVDASGAILGIHNSSHLAELPPGFNAGPDDDPADLPPSIEYAVIVSAAAVRRAFPEQLAALAALDAVEAPVAAGEPDWAVEAVAGVAPSVVSVWNAKEGEHPLTSDPSDPQCQRIPDELGSGVVIHPSGLVLSSADLFGSSDEAASVRTADGATYSAKVLERAKSSELVLLQVDLPEGTTLPAAALGDSGACRMGEQVAVVGRPFVPAVTLSVGLLSALEREGRMQLASWVHRGHWGGAVIDASGRLIGIAVDQPKASMRVTEESYLGFSAPLANALEAFADHLPELEVRAGDDAARANAPSAVAARTRDSLINILVSREVEKPAAGFSPFDEPESEFQLLGQGSGVIIDESGLALSNWHVVDAAVFPDGSSRPDHRVEVTLAGDRKYLAQVLSTSRDDDLSLLQILLPPGETIQPVELGDSDIFSLGEIVIAIGNPLGLSNSVSAGIVACIDTDVRIAGRMHSYPGMVATDAAINPGNSGGALLDTEGRLVGINSAGRTGLGLAIPVNKAREVFSDKLLSAERLRSSYLGLTVTERDGRVVVASVDEHGPAAAAGLEEGDRLRQVGETEISSGVAYAKVALAARPGTPLAVVAERDGEALALSLEPVSYTAWLLARQCGVQVRPLDYEAQVARVREASVLLHRAYTGNDTANPRTLMGGALEVVSARSLDPEKDLDVRPGDLLLGMTTYVRDAVADREELTRFEDLTDMHDALEPLATREGATRTFWLLRGDEVVEREVRIQRAPRN